MQSETLPKSTGESDSSRGLDERRLNFNFRKQQASTTSQRKLIVLILSLIFVIYAMIEAGKPERWFWLLPPESRSDSSRSGAIRIEVLEPRGKPSAEPQSTSSEETNSSITRMREGGANVDRNEIETKSISTDETNSLKYSTLPKLAHLDSSDYPASAQRFWAVMMHRMSTDQRRDLFQLLKRARQRQDLTEEKREGFQSLLNSIRAARAKYHQDLIDAATYSKDGEERAKLANDQFEAESTWDRSEWPALQKVLSGKKISDSQLVVLRRLQAVLDSLMLDFVSDRTAQGWEGDSPAWGRMWERLMFEERPASTPVTHLELSAQPATYRNQPVQVRGWIRGVWKEDLPIKELGIEHLYVLVVRPEDSKVTPYFLYARHLPEGFPQIEASYQPLNQRIVADGIFFKIRTYLDTQRTVQMSPMILVDQIRLVTGNESSQATAIAERFEPAWLIFGSILLTVIGAGVGWIAFRSARPQRFQPGPNRTLEIHSKLSGLADDPDIKTVHERIRELHERTN